MKFKSILILSALFFLLGDCKKYDEDGFISLRRPFKRLEGTWKIDQVIVDGNNITATYVDTLLQLSLSDLKLDFQEKNRNNTHLVELYGNSEHIGNFNYVLVPKTEDLSISTTHATSIDNQTLYLKLSTLLVDLWHVSKLYKKQLHITSKHNRNYEIYLIKE
jgi:hypothetical protein